jgi:MFS transporter, APGE family, 1-arseno-3-phosphoglycerate exporter
LLGTVMSGLSYQIGGLPLCLATAAVMLALSAIGAGQLRVQPKPFPFAR